jgi:hypothetical protein
MLEMKIVMIMTARRFEFQLAYEELDRVEGIKYIKPYKGMNELSRVMTFLAVWLRLHMGG